MDHEKLDVCRVLLDVVRRIWQILKASPRIDRSIRGPILCILPRAGFALLLLLSTSGVGANRETSGTAIVEAAQRQIGKTLHYDPGYTVLPYPGGDIPIGLGVCTDVVIRAFRESLGMDLQQLVHEDMKQHFSRYPALWGLRTPDRNIDHRRVPNLITYFSRMGFGLAVSDDPGDYTPGDLITCIIPPCLPHIMVVSTSKNSNGQPLVIHNIGGGTREEDRLFEFKITGHFRVAPRKGAPPSGGVQEQENAFAPVPGHRQFKRP